VRALAPLPVLLPFELPARCVPGDAGFVIPRAVFTGRALALLLATFALSLVVGEALAAPGRPGVVETILKWVPVIFTGFLFNLLVSVLAMGLGTFAGAGLGLAQISPVAPLSRVAWAATQFFRNAPWLVLLFYAMSLLPFQLTFAGWSAPFPPWIKAVVGLALPVMANVSEIVRGGVQSIPRDQWESAESLAFTRRQTLWLIVLPQAVKRMTPPWMNLYAILTMATPLISIIGIADAMTLTRGALSAEGRPELLIPMYLMLLVWFFLYSYPIARWTVRLEEKYAVNI